MKSPDIFNYAYLKSYVPALFSPPPTSYQVPVAYQQREVESLQATLGSKRFFFVNNLERFEAEQVHGVAQWLGYPEKEFTLQWYIDYVLHPGKKKSIILVAKQLYDSLCTGRYRLNFMVQRYSSLVALRHYRGHYLLANKISSVFQYDSKNRLTSYLNEFTIIGDYTGQPLGPNFFNNDGSPDPRGSEILQQTLQHFLNMEIFSPQQFQVARRMAYQPGTTYRKIAAEFGVAESTIKEYGDRFKDNVASFFHQRFRTTAEAALFVKEEGLL